MKIIIKTGVLLFFIIFSTKLHCQQPEANQNYNAYLELNQMLTPMVGCERKFNASWGVKAALGISPFSITTVSYNFMFVHHSDLQWKKWFIDIEAGIPLAYFDQIEDRYVDRDDIIDDPYAGWLFGADMVIYYRLQNSSIGLRLGFAQWIEHQQDSGWKGPFPMPVVSLVWDF
ncbi:MAG: hypothetical protein JXK07_08205 [Spirochaetes bacterium]|nr:hypothetical protein [Spirochaetota bacterium]MBN2771684.1 hypothetical protein [Spirochaetota bacterium]